jgi:hypothetical protein
MFQQLRLVTAFLITISCAAPPPARTETPAPTEPTVAKAAVSDAEARADALLEDMRRKQAAFDKLERETPTAPAPRLDEYVARPVASAPATPATSVQTPRAPDATSPTPTVRDEHDEPWWKGRMRDAEVALNDAVTRLAAAERAADQQRLQITYDKALAEVNARAADVVTARAAVERVREDARRANVPPGWLRWP